MNKKSEYEANRADWKRQYEIAERKMGELTASYELSQRDLSENLNQTLREGNQGIYVTTVQQQSNAHASASINSENQDLMYAELADLQEQLRGQVGSVISNAAGSGFRNTEGTTTAGLISDAEATAQEQYSRQLRAVQLSAYENYVSAANDYFSSNVQLENYRRAIANAQNTFDIKSEQLELDYTSNYNDLNDTYNYYKGLYDNSTWGAEEGWAAFLGGL